ncbi:MAG: exopolysaccharide biosynthesis protein [Pseudomonadota bacterium]
MADGFTVEQKDKKPNSEALSTIAFLKTVLVDLAAAEISSNSSASHHKDVDDPAKDANGASLSSDTTSENKTVSHPAVVATLGAVVERLDERAFGMMLLLFALPCCLPFVYLLPQIVALPMLALAAQMAFGREQPWLPDRLSNRRFDVDQFSSVIERSERYVGWFEAFAHPSLLFVTSRTGLRIVGALLLVPCASILIPLPATNTTPGIGVAIAALGLIERDGRLVALGLFIGFAWIAFLLIFGLEAASILKEWLTARF